MIFFAVNSNKIIQNELTFILRQRSNGCMSMFSGSIYIGVRNLEAATAWYIEKFELTKLKKPADEEDADVGLMSPDGKVFVFLSVPNNGDVDTPILFVKKIEKALEWLQAHSVNAGPVLTDGQSQYFEIRDLENNMIEICEDH